MEQSHFHLLTSYYKALATCKLKPQENQSSLEIMPQKRHLFLTRQDFLWKGGGNIYRLAIVLSEQTESQTQIELRLVALG